MSNAQNDDDFKGKIFVFTGELQKITREEAYDKVILGGGQIRNSVTSKTDVLVSCTTEATRKLETALEVQRKGGKVKIVDDDTFMRMLEDLDAVDIS